MRLDFQGGKAILSYEKFQCEKAILSYKKMYFDNTNYTDGMYKINTTIPNSIINEIFTSLYSSTLWHNRLGQVNYRLKKLCLLSNCGSNKPKKCEVGVYAKITRKSFSNVTRSINMLDLIDSDTYDLKSFLTRGGIKYFITFNDNHSRFCHVYLLKLKDETFSKFIEF